MRSLRSKILSIQALAITTTVIILGSMSYALMTDALLSVQRHNLTHLAVTSAHNINRNLTDLQDKFRNIMIGHDMHRASDLPMAKYMAKYQEIFPVLSLVNREGREELTMIQQRIAITKELKNWHGTDIFNHAMSIPNKVILSPEVKGLESGNPWITMAMAQVEYFGDEFKGILIGSALVQKVLERIDSATTANGEFLVVIDADQRIIYPLKHDTQASLSQTTSQIESGLLAMIRASTSAFLEASVFGQKSYVAYQTDTLSGWTALAVLPSDVFLAAPNHLRNMTLIICLALLAGGAFIAQRLSSRLTRDIVDLTEHTRQIAAGDLHSRVMIDSQDEIAVLGESFNEMSDRLLRSQDSRNRLDTILQSIIDPLLVTDATGLIQHYNNAAIQMLQCTDDDLQGVALSQIFAEQFCPDSGKSLLTVALETSVQNHETLVRTCAGGAIPVLLSCSYVRMATEQESGLVVILKDISVRKRIEEDLNLALAEAEAARDQVNAILRSVADGLIVTDTNQNIVLMNRSSEKLFEVKLQSLLNKPIQNLITDRAVLANLSEHLENPTSSQDVEFEVKRSDDSALRLVHARSAPVRNKGGLPKGLITILRDVTDERKMEKIKNEFISTAAHELNTPLATIMGFTEFLIEPEVYGGFTDAQRKEFLVEILDKTDVLARIVSDLLDLSRMEAGQAMPLLKSREDLSKTIHKALRRYQVSGNSHQFDLKLNDSEVVEVLIDQQRIIQVLENLISNALKYSPPDSRIVISARRNGDYAMVSIADQGVGMTKEQASRSFDKFYRADSSNTAVKGLGMGMSIVQTIIQAHEGTINVSSKPGAGTTVTFGLLLLSSESLQ